ncbi:MULTISPECIES: cache domain-containing protein [unclassified Methylobacterium]|uniref:cache domain-containing protein n=1 Tax=unclassified Methylobacterium TaxID=2615210 RepID=UPI0007014565|nr:MULTISPECIES: cache domain-containing protein [unclassified Methylobacterium]KQS77542.1 sodium:calcium antiporter [Methylobacterium sp. Leaf361]MBP1178293.1 signal transduction histidine kinase [Methylobacterium sp. PvR107]
MFKTLAACLMLLILVAPSPVLGRGKFPISHQAAEIESLVNKASDVLVERGSEAFADFRTKGSSWRYADVYLFVVDMNGIVLFNAARPDREERDFLDDRDADGKRFHRDFIEVVKTFGSGWVDYMFPKPGQSHAHVKWSYICATRVDGVDALVGAGVYVD